MKYLIIFLLLSFGLSAQVKVTELPAKTNADSSYLMIIARPSDSKLYKMTLDNLKDSVIGVTGSLWGSITGTLSNQTDLQNALNAKQNTITTGTTAQYFRGDLSLATFPTTTASFSNSIDKNFVTDAQLVVIGNTSGTNTGDQVISDATITTSDITTNNFTIAKHGFTPKGTNVGNFLRDDGTWAAPSGGGDMLLASTQTNSGAKTFLDGTFLLRNIANTFNGVFTNTNTALRTYTLKDASGTVAFTSDITGTNSGTNTGDQTITLTSDVTGSGTGSFATTIAAGAVTLSKMADVATASVFYRKTAGTGSPEVNTLATLKTDLGLTGTNSGDQTSIVGITGTIAQFNTALTDGDFATGGGTATGTNTGDNAVNTLYSGLVSNATHTGDATGATALTVVGINGALLSGLATGILKNTTTTGVPSIAVAGDFPTLNQNTTGSAAILTTTRAIYGNDFNGSTALTQIIASTYGGTGNGFTKFSGATISEKTYTLPDASTTILTTNYTGALATGIVKNTTTTGALTIAIAGDFPTLNQNTTGSAATLTTARNINGVAFDGSANITITADANTLTGTVLNSTVVTSSLTSVGTIATGVWNGTDIAVSDGGTGASTLTGVLIGSGTSAITGVAGTASQVLRRNAANTAYEFFTLGAGAGDVVGPASSVASEIALFDGTTGKLIKSATGSGLAVSTSGVFSVVTLTGTTNEITVTNGAGGGTPTFSLASTLDLTGKSTTVQDNNFLIQDNLTTTKKIAFEVSGLTAATTRTVTFPDADITLVGVDATQTLTNKTISQSQITNLTSDLALKAALASPTFTGTVVLPSTTSIGTITNTELSYVDGVTSAIQTQIDAKQATLVSGINLRTVQGLTLLGSTNIATYTTFSMAGDYTPTLTDGIIQIVHTESTSRTINLPTAVSSTAIFIIVHNSSTAGNTLTIEGNGSQTISGDLNIVLRTQYESVILTSDGINWFIN